jgi:preprotein translocase subunit Sec61beta
MFITHFIQNKQIHPKYFVYICLGVLLLLGLLHIFMISILFPQQAGWMNLHIPSRSGGYDYLIDTGTFITMSSIALVIAIVATIFVAGMVRLAKAGFATAITFLLLASSCVYVGLFIGSAFSILWGGLWATIGVLGVVAIGFAMEMPLLAWMNQNLKKK